jgi:hypothetical protein
MLSIQSNSVPFKEVWAANSNIKLVQVNPHWTIQQFIWSIKPVLKVLFKLENYEFDIVPMNQIYNVLHHIIPELAAPLEESNRILRSIWGQNLDVMFYVRKQNYFYPELSRLNIAEGECPVCMNNTLIRRHYSCQHKFCEQCYSRIIQINNCCPECRST